MYDTPYFVPFSTCGGFNLSFSEGGAINSLRVLSSGNVWATHQSKLMELLYQTLSFHDFAEFYTSYFYMGGGEACTPTSAGFPCGSYGKPGLDGTAGAEQAKSQLLPARMRALYYRQLEATATTGQFGGTGCMFQVEMSFPAEAVAEYGAPALVMLEVKIDGAADERKDRHHQPQLHPFSATLRMYNKTTTRRPEAMWLRMQPVASSRIELNSASLTSTTENCVHSPKPVCAYAQHA